MDKQEKTLQTTIKNTIRNTLIYAIFSILLLTTGKITGWTFFEFVAIASVLVTFIYLIYLVYLTILKIRLKNDQNHH